MTTWDKYGKAAHDWSEDAYANYGTYLSRRANVVRIVGSPLEPGDSVLDLACGDGGLAEFLPAQRYLGVDANSEMVAAGRRHGRKIVQADLNDYEPPSAVHATTLFRAVYYAHDRRELFCRIAGYTEKKFVFDLNPRQYRLSEVRADVKAAGFARFETRPFFVPQSHKIPTPLLWSLIKLERSGPVATLLLRLRFTLLCAAVVDRGVHPEPKSEPQAQVDGGPSVAQ